MINDFGSCKTRSDDAWIANIEWATLADSTAVFSFAHVEDN